MSIELKLKQSQHAIESVNTLKDLEQLRISLLGKQSELTQSLKNISQLPPRERPHAGEKINQVKKHIQAMLEKQKKVLEAQTLNQQIKTQKVDITLPGRGMPLGTQHPLTKTKAQLEDLFLQAGFKLMTGPEIENEENNFTALNIPKHHPARALHDTFYLDHSFNLLLRTHTSTVQIKALKQCALPLRIIATGRVYRCDSDVTHTPMFHQLEGMVIDQTANFAELKGLLIQFLRTFFDNPNLTTRFRTAYFPFTEPSAEVDIQCVLCRGQGCAACKKSGWLEILGCGMVHPNVLRGANIDPDFYQGYAFGMGIDRLTLLRYQIPDLRLLFENDLNFLTQFKSL